MCSGQLCLSKSVLCCLIHESYVRSVGRHCFVRNYATIPVQLEAVILRYVGWCVLIIIIVPKCSWECDIQNL